LIAVGRAGLRWRDPVRSVRSLGESYRPCVGKETIGAMGSSRRRRHSPEQIIRKLREADRLLGEGQEVAVVAKQLEVSEQTLQRWRAQYGGLKADDAKRLKELERENARLKRIVADQLLENQALKEIAKGNF
jgi:putative transposase